MANKVYHLSEQVEQGSIVVAYIEMAEQCVDSLTKFLKRGAQQAKAREHLSLCEIDDNKAESRRLAQAARCDSSGSASDCKVARVSVRDWNASSGSENDSFLSVAISSQKLLRKPLGDHFDQVLESAMPLLCGESQDNGGIIGRR